MRLSEILTPALIKLNLEATDKSELIEEMVSFFSRQGLLASRQTAVSELEQREARQTTAVVPGVAFPHARLENIKDVMVGVGVSQDGVDFNSLDRQPTHVFFVIFSEAGNPGPHLQLLAELSRMFADNRVLVRAIREARTPEAVIQLIANEE